VVDGFIKIGCRRLRAFSKTTDLLTLQPAAIFVATGWEFPLSVDWLTQLLGEAIIPEIIGTIEVQLSSLKKLVLNLDAWITYQLRFSIAQLIVFDSAFLCPLGELEKNIGILQVSMPASILTSIIVIEYDLVPDFDNLSLALDGTWCVFPDNPQVYHISRYANISVTP